MLRLIGLGCLCISVALLHASQLIDCTEDGLQQLLSGSPPLSPTETIKILSEAKEADQPFDVKAWVDYCAWTPAHCEQIFDSIDKFETSYWRLLNQSGSMRAYAEHCANQRWFLCKALKEGQDKKKVEKLLSYYANYIADVKNMRARLMSLNCKNVEEIRSERPFKVNGYQLENLDAYVDGRLEEVYKDCYYQEKFKQNIRNGQQSLGNETINTLEQFTNKMDAKFKVAKYPNQIERIIKKTLDYYTPEVDVDLITTIIFPLATIPAFFKIGMKGETRRSCKKYIDLVGGSMYEARKFFFELDDETKRWTRTFVYCAELLRFKKEIKFI